MALAEMMNDTGETMVDLGDIPDLSALEGASSGPVWENAWYQGEILAERRFTDKNGSERVFESNDTVSNAGDSRNIRLQVKVTRASDARELFISALINYRPEDLTPEVVQAVINDNDKPESDRDRSLVRARLTLARLASLQKIAGVRQFQRTEEGGLDLTPLFGKMPYVKLKEDDRNPAFKQIAAFREDRPTRAQVL